MDAPGGAQSLRDSLAYAALRVTVGCVFLAYGVEKLREGPLRYAIGLEGEFGRTWLPVLGVFVFGLVLPFLETALGVLLILGWLTPAAVACGAALMALLTLGLAVLGNAGGVAHNLIFALVFHLLLVHAGDDRLSLDALLRASRRPRPAPSPDRGGEGPENGPGSAGKVRWQGKALVGVTALAVGGALESAAAETGAAPRPSMRAARATSPIALDGRLSEAAWLAAEPATGFVQREPEEGRAATEETEVRVLYDDEMLYVGVLCLDSRPDRVTAPSHKRDYEGFLAGDYFGMVLDTFHDRQNAFGFGTNPAGAEDDWQVAGDGAFSDTQWDGVWYVATSRDERGWAAEFAIPFRTLRFEPGDDRTWGANFWRYLARRAEHSYWSPLPRQFRIDRISMAGELRGLSARRPGRNLQLKPFTLATTTAGLDGHADVDAGVDLKYSVTPALTLDLTYRTDFSHVEADTEQINLTRFPLLFPEKRDFFLESAGIFRIIPSGFTGDLMPFFSRRIGLSPAGRPVPVRGGARLAGKLGGRTSMGWLYMRTDALESDPLSGEAVPATDFVAARLRRDLGQHGGVGAIAVERGHQGTWSGLGGTDAEVKFLRYGRLLGYWLKSWSPSLVGSDHARYIEGGWSSPGLQTTLSALDIQKNFRADVGFLPRPAIRKYYGSSRFIFRPRWPAAPFLKEIAPGGWLAYYAGQDGSLETRSRNLSLDVVLRDSSSMTLSWFQQLERLAGPFAVGSLSVPSGPYAFGFWRLRFQGNRAWRLSPTLQLEHGGFWDGERASVQVEASWFRGPAFSVSGLFRRERVSLPRGEDTLFLAGLHTAYAPSKRSFFDLKLQYNSSSRRLLVSGRLDLVHRPLSHVYVSYNEAIDVDAGASIERSLAVKVTLLMPL